MGATAAATAASATTSGAVMGSMAACVSGGDRLAIKTPCGGIPPPDKPRCASWIVGELKAMLELILPRAWSAVAKTQVAAIKTAVPAETQASKSRSPRPMPLERPRPPEGMVRRSIVLACNGNRIDAMDALRDTAPVDDRMMPPYG